MIRSRRLLAAGAAAAGLALALPALPAAAGPAASGPSEASVIDIDRVVIETDFCGISGLTVEVHEVVRGREFFTFRGRDSLPYYHVTLHERTTYTEPDGTTVTVTSNTVNKDQRVVDNGDGTFTVTAFGAGGFKLSGPAGTLRNPGRIVVRFDVDTGGTPRDPSDDVEVPGTFEVIRESTGLNETGDDFCSDYLVVTGRAD